MTSKQQAVGQRKEDQKSTLGQRLLNLVGKTSEPQGGAPGAVNGVEEREPDESFTVLEDMQHG